MNILLVFLTSFSCYFFTGRMHQRLVVCYPKYASPYSTNIKVLALIINIVLQLKFIYRAEFASFFMYDTYQKLLFTLCIALIMVLSSSLSIAFVIDVLTHELPNELNLISGICLIPVSIFLYSGTTIVTGITVFIIYLMLALLSNSFGMGDVKLALAIGIGLKFSLLFKFIFIAFLFASIMGILKILANKGEMKSEIAFGPYIIISFLLLF